MSGVNIGLKNLHIATLTSDDNTGAVYATPEKMAKAVGATVTPNVSNNTFYADDGPSETNSSLGQINVSIGVDQLPKAMQATLLGHSVNSEGVLIKKSDDQAPYIALGFESMTSTGEVEYVWLYKGKFQLNERSYTTKGESIEYQNPTLNATFVKRDFDGAWQASVNSGDSDITQTVIDNWFNAVYEETVV